MPEQFGVFAKYWQPGQAKTRLAAGIGAAAASELYLQFIRTTLHRFRQVADRRVAVVTPVDREDEFRGILPEEWDLQRQTAGDLGARMAAYFARAFAAGFCRVVLIGTDSPTLPRRFVAQAFEALMRNDVVLGPAEDGGYYLIGFRQQATPGMSQIFERIIWSGPDVFEATRERIAEARLSAGLLPRWYDVDDLAALLRLSQDVLNESPPWDQQSPDEKSNNRWRRRLIDTLATWTGD